MIQYDSAVIHQFAEKLYAQARYIVAGYIARYLVVRVLVGIGANYAMRGIQSTPVQSSDDPNFVLVAIFALIGSLAGYATGREKSFALRLQAQTALCQL